MIGIVGMGVFFVVGLFVSLRLLGLWRKTRQLPELTAGMGLLGIGPLGFCVLLGGPTLAPGTRFAYLSFVTGLAVQALGFLSASVFTWRVFRPGARWARAFPIVLGAGLAVALVGYMVVPIGSGQPLWHFHLDIWLKATCLAWGAAESLGYWRVTRQRVAIGFADAVVSASFLCWGIALSAAALGFLGIYFAVLALRPGEHLGAGVEVALSSCGMITASALFLAFLPPKAYARWLATRSPAAEAHS
ncbi:MAG TPA: hypothetical protein VKM54_03755 [Myxococcota bacterium]|nr:hypothetical protein [Myxococcota bacterium]